MKKLYVHAAFYWLKEIELIGESEYESFRCSDSYISFNDECKGRDSYSKIYKGIRKVNE